MATHHLGEAEWVPGVSGKASPCGRSHHAWPPGVSMEQSTSHPQPFRALQPDLAQETPDAAAFGTSSAPATCSDTPEGFSYLATNSPRSGFNSISFTDSEKRIKDCSLPQGLGSLSSCPQESRLIKQCFLLFGYPPWVPVAVSLYAEVRDVWLVMLQGQFGYTAQRRKVQQWNWTVRSQNQWPLPRLLGSTASEMISLTGYSIFHRNIWSRGSCGHTESSCPGWGHIAWTMRLWRAWPTVLSTPGTVAPARVHTATRHFPATKKTASYLSLPLYIHRPVPCWALLPSRYCKDLRLCFRCQIISLTWTQESPVSNISQAKMLRTE